MRQALRAVLLAILFATPICAEPIAGLNDPAFRDPFDRLLQADDPLALLDLHKAAIAGNTAALLAIPSALNWIGPEIPTSVRKQVYFINGVHLYDALAKADPVAEAWKVNGDIGGSDFVDALLASAFTLYAAGEAEKGTELFLGWQHRTPAYAALPPGFFDLPVPDWAMAMHLQDRLTYVGGDHPLAAEALLVERLKLDDLAGWMGLALYSGLHLPPENRGKVDQQRIDRILAATGYTPADGLARMAEMIPVLQAFKRNVAVLDAKTALAAAAAFSKDTEFGAVATFCEVRCPATATACAAAYVAAFGHPQGKVTEAQPFVSLISQDAFFSSPRGQKVLLQSTHSLSGTNRADSPVQIALRQIDACLADAILASHP